MTDREFADAFEALAFPPDAFHHRDHVRLAWVYLREQPLLPALTRFSENLKRFAANAGAAAKYHETITFAFLFLIHERMQHTPAKTFDEFAQANQDLVAWSPSILERYYRPETLASDGARTGFVMPDRGVAQWSAAALGGA